LFLLPFHDGVIHTLFLGIDVKLGGSDGRFSNSIIGDALDDAVVTSTLHRLHSEHAAMRHVDHHVPLSPRGDPSTGLPPVDVRGRVPGRLAEEADDPAVDDALISRRQRDFG